MAESKQITGELYVGQDGNIFKIKRSSENAEFFKFEIFAKEDLKSLTDFLIRNNKRAQKNACLEGDNHKAPGTGARTETESSTRGGDYLQK